MVGIESFFVMPTMVAVYPTCSRVNPRQCPHAHTPPNLAPPPSPHPKSQKMSLSLPTAPQTHADSLALERTLLFPSFDATTAWTLGTILRTRLLASPTPCLVHIATTAGVTLFACATRPGTVPDNEKWVARKTATVLRWGCSSWAFGRKFAGDEVAFASKFGLGAGAGAYAIHGGAVPVYVRGVEGAVGVVVVSGLKQEEDHMIVVEAMREVIGSMSGV